MNVLSTNIKFSREWAMPNPETFKIPPIRSLLNRYVVGAGWADVFAGYNSPAQITNDLNPKAPTAYHLDALDFARLLENDELNGVLFDPPYSLRQIKEMYQGFGKPLSNADAVYLSLAGTQKPRAYGIDDWSDSEHFIDGTSRVHPPNFIVRYVCMTEENPCDEEQWEIVEGFEL